ncbi:hypothetical protein QYE76_011565 [Lolium multiflorum]|uniref:Uncharacterized protein n=1 Tax=Lolium multiflorum TaxID=4521 RepID=A0AAD8TZ54_LOLMU|nr:hypothetical protein QYE76_011565 [Lolium multiflorum]
MAPHLAAARRGRATLWKRTPDDAEELLAKIGRNHDDWSTSEPTPTPIVKKRGMIKLNDEDMREAKKSLKEKDNDKDDTPDKEEVEKEPEKHAKNKKYTKEDFIAEKHERKMKKFKFGELFKKGTTSTGRPSRASTQIRRSYNEDIIAPSFAPEEDNGAPNASSFPCYDFLTNAGILDDFFTLVNKAGLATYVGDEREQYYMLTKIFVESFKFHNTQYEPTVAFKIYGNPVTMELEEFCRALDIAPVGTAGRIDDNPQDLLELYRGITEDDCRTIQRGKIRNIQLPAIKYFAYYIATSILAGLFNIDRQSWSLTKEEVEEHMKIQDFHQHDSEDAEPSYDCTVTYPDASSSTYLEPGRSSSYYGDTTSWGPWEGTPLRPKA